MNKNLPVKSVSVLETVLDSQKDNLIRLLPYEEGTPPEVMLQRMQASILAAVAENPKLLECTQSSIVKAAFEACEMGLEVHGPLDEAWIIPYGGEAQFQIGFRGMLKLAFNAGFVRNVVSRKVYENDEFEYMYGGGATPGYIYLKEAQGGRGELRGVMCIVDLATGAQAWEFYDRAALEAWRENSQSYRTAKKYGKIERDKIWGDEHNTEEMYRKAVWMNMQKWIPKSGGRYARALEISHREYSGQVGYGEVDAEEALYRAVSNKALPAGRSDFKDQMLDLFDVEEQTDEMRSIVRCILTEVKRGTTEVTRVVEPEDLWALTRKDEEKILGVINRCRTHLGSDDRVLTFLRYCDFNNYLLARSRMVDQARSAFIDYEKDLKAGGAEADEPGEVQEELPF